MQGTETKGSEVQEDGWGDKSLVFDNTKGLCPFSWFLNFQYLKLTTLWLSTSYSGLKKIICYPIVLTGTKQWKHWQNVNVQSKGLYCFSENIAQQCAISSTNNKAFLRFYFFGPEISLQDLAG